MRCGATMRPQTNPGATLVKKRPSPVVFGYGTGRAMGSAMESTTLKKRTRAQQGSQTIEFGLVIVPLFAFMFLIMDISWAVFSKPALQHAVRRSWPGSIVADFQEF